MTDASESIDLDELRKLAEAATPGERTYGGQGWVFADRTVGGRLPEDEFHDLLATVANDADGRFIAAAGPDALLFLLDRLRVAEWKNAALVAEHDAALIEKLADEMLAGITMTGFGEHVLIDDAHGFLMEQAQARREQA